MNSNSNNRSSSYHSSIAIPLVVLVQKTEVAGTAASAVVMIYRDVSDSPEARDQSCLGLSKTPELGAPQTHRFEVPDLGPHRFLLLLGGV